MYLLADEQTKEAIAIDPLAHKLCIETASKHGYRISKVVNTHHHLDHIGGNDKVIKATGAKLLAHVHADIPHVDIALMPGDLIKLGSHELQVLDTPGHTMSHVCLFYDGKNLDLESGKTNSADEPALFSGDTLFNAGVGHCYLGGHPEELFATISNCFNDIPRNTRLFPGHDYIENNLGFTLDREPSNIEAKRLLTQFQSDVDAEAYVTTLEQEEKINVFMRLDSEEVRNKLNQEGFTCHDNKSTFLALRETRNQW